MFQWIFDNVKGVHQKKKQELKNLDEYWEFMIEDFNKRLKFAVFVGTVVGTAIGGAGVYLLIG